jgi:hypothetical protein
MRRNLVRARRRNHREATGGAEAPLRQALVHEGFDHCDSFLGDERDG